MKIGLMGIGLKTYWTQYEGLFPRLCAYSDEIHSRMVAMGGEVVNVGFVDCPERAMQAVEVFNGERI
jgi:L-arabinose isomerase